MYDITISEELYPHTPFLTINASDADAGRNMDLLFSIVPPHDVIIIDALTGEVSLRVEVDYEDVQMYEVTVSVRDSGEVPLTSDAQLIVRLQDVNDEHPVFDRSVYTFTLEENLSSGTYIGQLNSSDEDSSPYNITKMYWKNPNISDWNTLFDLDTDTGVISSRTSFDRERRGHYNMMVMAVNPDRPSMSSTAMVAIMITDKNDNTPVFVFPSHVNSSVNLPNRVPPGYAFTQVEALDPDMGVNARLEYALVRGSQEGLFSINSHSGVISVTQGVDVDQDTDFLLSIMVSDTGLPPCNTIATLVVKVNTSRHLGLNDWPNSMDGAEVQSRPTNRTIIIALCCITVVIVVALISAIIYLRCTNPKPKKNSGMYDQKLGTSQSDTAVVVPVKSPLDNIDVYSEYGGLRTSSRIDFSSEWKAREIQLKPEQVRIIISGVV